MDQRLDAPVEVGQVDLFVGRVGVVIREAKADLDDGHAKHVLELAGDGL
jgi:hypothetical protein